MIGSETSGTHGAFAGGGNLFLRGVACFFHGFAHFALDFFHQRFVGRQQILDGVTALCESPVAVRIPRTAFFDYVEINAEVYYLPYFGDTFAVHDVEFGAAERRSHLVLDDFDFGSCTELLFTVLDAGGFADIDADGSVELSHVYFSYTPEQKLIEDFNLSVQPGQRVAIVGPTGCGKTTLINLLMRFYDVNSGEIRVSGTPIDEMTRKSLRSNYGMVLQETWLRSGTIRENITMGKPDATEEEIIAAAKASHAHSFIKRLPKGYDTVISEDGGSLSQGQKQLLCITRVMLCLPPMLILDEATSSIDTRTEIKIQEAFARMMKGRTSFIVAHRLSTIREADIILVMRDGNIVEQGKHEELLEKNGFYAKLYNSQFAK